ncbi:carboxymuconolactone decarboxylase family protein [Bifidobacterium olomucense]|uniref:Carboxymuconolactone decarboxylase n=1 Tax=Bifidobacterium olomucense TaxID=2675324 RepID=A0A7Y0EX23_9BIFI|nr:carboxymuconolactone decarboxylase family protein [Bifidobacterium sp. DSM 109959]NMM97985.1 carboxymuconolactone decarboxylase [Bifidobacterium sp. DSM 109959]
MSDNQEQGSESLFADTTLAASDPELVEFFGNFVDDEVRYEPGANHPDMDERTRWMAILAVLVGCQGHEAFALMAPKALDAGLTSVQLKEIVYQATAYLGFGRVLPFVDIVNHLLADRGVNLPLESQSTTTPETRAAAGEQSQIDIFGAHMRGFAQTGPEETRHINKWLVDNCFGDYYTRGGLDVRQREMITLCFLAAQGGCEPQLTAHAGANLHVGNEQRFLIAVVSQCMPYLGYPRTLNAIRCINEAAAKAA